MSKILDWLELMAHESRRDAVRYNVDEFYTLSEHKNEVFYAMLRYLERETNATLEFLGSDMGGPIYRVTEE